MVRVAGVRRTESGSALDAFNTSLANGPWTLTILDDTQPKRILTRSPLVGTVASRFMGRIVGEVMQVNQAAANKIPGLGSLMSFGTGAASKARGAADKQFEAMLASQPLSDEDLKILSSLGIG